MLFDVESPFLYNDRGKVAGATFSIQAISGVRGAFFPAVGVNLCSCLSMPVGVADSWVGRAVREQCVRGDKLTSQVVYRCHRRLEDGADAQPADLNTLRRREAGLVGGSIVDGRRGIECVELKGHWNDGTVHVSSGDNR